MVVGADTELVDIIVNRVTASDAAGNVSALSAPLVVQTVDITPPSVPTNLVVTKVTATSASLSWKLSTGIGGVGGYYVLRGTSPGSLSIHADVTGAPYTDPYVRPSTTYYYEVKAYNSLGFSLDQATKSQSKARRIKTGSHCSNA